MISPCRQVLRWNYQILIRNVKNDVKDWIILSVFFLKVTCGQCNTRKLKLWPEAKDIKFACADPLCRLNNMVTIFR